MSRLKVFLHWLAICFSGGIFESYNWSKLTWLKLIFLLKMYPLSVASKNLWGPVYFIKGLGLIQIRRAQCNKPPCS